jgi:thioredoxin reductase (NADPH)
MIKQSSIPRTLACSRKMEWKPSICRTVTGIDCSEETFLVSLNDDKTVAARSVVIATGARYRKLNVAELQRFEGAGVHYSATPIDVRPCVGQPIVIVGGGNSAGQAAMFLSARASHVHMLIRGSRLSTTCRTILCSVSSRRRPSPCTLVAKWWV